MPIRHYYNSTVDDLHGKYISFCSSNDTSYPTNIVVVLYLICMLQYTLMLFFTGVTMLDDFMVIFEVKPFIIYGMSLVVPFFPLGYNFF